LGSPVQSRGTPADAPLPGTRNARSHLLLPVYLDGTPLWSSPNQPRPPLLPVPLAQRGGRLGSLSARGDVLATPTQGGLWARAAPRRPGRGRDHPDDGRFRGRGNSGSPPGGGNVQDGVIEGLAAGVPRRNHSSSPGRSSAEPIWAPSLQCRHPQTRLRKTQEFYCCQLLHDGMFRAAPHQNDARHVSGRR
jgi:hypothetical protein